MKIVWFMGPDGSPQPHPATAGRLAVEVPDEVYWRFVEAEAAYWNAHADLVEAAGGAGKVGSLMRHGRTEN